MTDPMETALREWLKRYSTKGAFDYWELDDEDLPKLATHLKAAGFVMVDEVAFTNSVLGRYWAAPKKDQTTMAISIAIRDTFRAMTTPSDGGGG